jgi:uncharacterized protein (TIRG00374 family)
MATHEGSFLKRNWKIIVNVVTVVALVVLIILIRDQIVQTFHDLEKLNGWMVALVLPLTVIGYHAQTKVYQDLFALLGNKLHYKFLFRAALELNFVNQVFPSGGVSGISYFGVRLRDKDLTATKASLVQIMKLLLLFISFEVLLIIGLIVMAIDGQANDFVVLVAGSISTLLVIGTVVFVMVISSERRIHTTFVGITHLLNKIFGLFRRHKPETIRIARVEGVLQDLHQNYKIIESNYHRLKAPFFWSMVVNISAICSIYAIYVAFGEWVNIGAIILAYSVANFAGLVSVLPGGVGIYEALMTGVLAAAGIPAALSLPVTVMFRVISTVIQLPPGYVLYHQTVHRTKLDGDVPLAPHE